LARNDLQHIMSAHASVVRDADGLTLVEHELRAAPPRAPLTNADAENIALTVTARAVVAAALARTETRGCHHRGDYPHTDPAQARSVTARLASDGRVVVDAPVHAGACG
jgi:L-aspartate oxidase